jgi:hypothetical protein
VDTVTATVYDNRIVSGFMDYPRITLAQCGQDWLSLRQGARSTP